MKWMATHDTTTPAEKRNGTASNWVRYGALASVLAGVAFAVEGIMILAEVEHLGRDFVFAAGVLLGTVGIIGLHTVQKEHYGRLGRAGFVLVVGASLVQVAGAVGGFTFGIEVLAVLYFPALIAVIVGFVTYGAATVLAGVFPRWVGALVVAMPVVIFVLRAYSGPVVALIWAALGYALWSEVSGTDHEGVVSESKTEVG